AKRRRTAYIPGRRSDAWIKVRFVQRQELVVGGFKPMAAGFDSLVVGYFDGRRLMSAGKVRAGFTPQSRAQLFARLQPLVVKRCPFANLPSATAGHWGQGMVAEEIRDLRWVKPAVIVEVAFTEWTRDGSLRHAAFAGVRDDKRAADVRREPTSSSSA